jgi:predicted 3-demethylubiquinone-9 3-methyltransferase (glyoxalase superfamily)
MSQTITPFLWFDGQAEVAMEFYCGIFPDTKILHVTRMGDVVQYVQFMLQGQEFMGLNAGPEFQFTEAVSFFVSCDTQEEVDSLWEKLTADGGEESQCGWLKDKFGLSWQIIPKRMGQLLSDSDREAAGRAMQAMLGMQKISVPELEAAFAGK